MRRVGWAVLVLTLATCSGSGEIVHGGPDAAPISDARPAPDACPTASCGARCCRADQTCAYDSCVPPTPCTANDECQDDSYCDVTTHLCIVYGIGPGAIIDGQCANIEPAGVFTPAVQCEWVAAGTDPRPGHKNVYSTPMVVDFDFDGDRSALRPSIVFVSSDSRDCGNDECVGDDQHFGVIRVIDGKGCTTQHSIDSPKMVPAATLAVGDLDGDGRADIVGYRVGGGVVAFGWNAVEGSFRPLWDRPLPAAAGLCMWSGPSIHDLDDDGHAEVLAGGTVLDGATGAIIDGHLGLLQIPGPVGQNGGNATQIPVAADLDGDGAPELVAGDKIYEWSKAARLWVDENVTLGAAGLVAVADFGSFGDTPGADDRSRLDGKPEIVVVFDAGGLQGQVRIVTPSGRVVMPPTKLQFFPPSTVPGNGGPPTVGDFDGDGRAEVGVAGKGGYTVFDLDCAGTPGAATCASGRTDLVLWASKVQDDSSSQTGSAVFDFEADGTAEVIYADECFARVFDGKTGDVLFSQFRNSATWYENPVVADVDGDLRSEIVIPSNDNCSIACEGIDPKFTGLRCLVDAECPSKTTCKKESDGDRFGLCRCGGDGDCGGNGYLCVDPVTGPSARGKVCRASHPALPFRGVRVIKDALDRWVSSRPVWNQHAYAVTNVNDDGTIPRTSAWMRNWTVPKLDNFRQNINPTLDNTKLADLTVRGAGVRCTDGTSRATLSAQVCNRGNSDVGGGVALAFYQGEPSEGQRLCSVRTATALAPAGCETVSCEWLDAPTTAQGVVVTGVVDDDGDRRECHESNNRMRFDNVSCFRLP